MFMHYFQDFEIGLSDVSYVFRPQPKRSNRLVTTAGQAALLANSRDSSIGEIRKHHKKKNRYDEEKALLLPKTRSRHEDSISTLDEADHPFSSRARIGGDVILHEKKKKRKSKNKVATAKLIEVDENVKDERDGEAARRAIIEAYEREKKEVEAAYHKGDVADFGGAEMGKTFAMVDHINKKDDEVKQQSGSTDATDFNPDRSYGMAFSKAKHDAIAKQRKLDGDADAKVNEADKRKIKIRKIFGKKDKYSDQHPAPELVKNVINEEKEKSEPKNDSDKIDQADFVIPVAILTSGTEKDPEKHATNEEERHSDNNNERALEKEIKKDEKGSNDDDDEADFAELAREVGKALVEGRIAERDPKNQDVTSERGEEKDGENKTKLTVYPVLHEVKNEKPEVKKMQDADQVDGLKEARDKVLEEIRSVGRAMGKLASAPHQPSHKDKLNYSSESDDEDLEAIKVDNDNPVKVSVVP